MRDPLGDLCSFIEAYAHRHPGCSKFELASATADEFQLRRDRAIYHRPEFALRFSSTSTRQFSNTVVSLRALRTYDHVPFIVCVVRPSGVQLLLSNSTFLSKISHSSHRLSLDNVRGSFLGHDILRTYAGLTNAPADFPTLFALHAGRTWEENLERLVIATAAITPSIIRYQPSPAEVEAILRAPELATRLSDHPEYRQLYEDLDRLVQHNGNRILELVQIDNVNLRGNAIEQLVTEAGNLHAADDVQRTLTIADVRVDIKTKILTLASSPKGYNIDKILRLLGVGNVAFSFFIIGVHPGESRIATVLVSILDRTILNCTRVQFHWAGRHSRGVTQLSGNLAVLFEPGFAESIDEPAARAFLARLIEIEGDSPQSS